MKRVLTAGTILGAGPDRYRHQTSDVDGVVMEQTRPEPADGRNKAVVTRCPRCGDTDHIWVNADDHVAWKEGTLIQEALPYLSKIEREQLMTGLCSPCWDKTYDLEEPPF